MKPDTTHDPQRESWIDTANLDDCDFPIQNLPYACGRRQDGVVTAIVAIGDEALDLVKVHEAGMLEMLDGVRIDGEIRLTQLLGQSAEALTGLRHRLVQFLERDSVDARPLRDAGAVRPRAEFELLPPTKLGSFTDFWAGIFHAKAATRILVPGGELAPNYRWIPIAYQSRAGGIRTTGAAITRPSGQIPTSEGTPVFGKVKMLDFELELGVFIANTTSAGTPVPIAQAPDSISGFCLLNDWTARDIQRWETFPLGPFLSKSFATTISPWVVTTDALRPFRVPAMSRGDDEPEPLAYLSDAEDQQNGGLSIELAVHLQTAHMRAAGSPAELLVRSNAKHLYWTPAQMVAHHTSNGCDLQAGDVIGTGTISGPNPEQSGSLLELTEDGRKMIKLANGEERGYLEDGDEITFTAKCVRDGFKPIGFGDCTGRVAPALA